MTFKLQQYKEGYSLKPGKFSTPALDFPPELKNVNIDLLVGRILAPTHSDVMNFHARLLRLRAPQSILWFEKKSLQK